MITMTIEIEGIEDAINKINSLGPKLREAVKDGTIKGLRDMGHIANTLLASRTKGVAEPRGNDITDSWSEPKITYHGNTIKGSLYNYSQHWRAVEFGTAEKADGQDTEFMTTLENIYPIGDSPLRFKYLGHWYSKWEVKGQEPKAFIRGAIPFSRDLIKQYIKIQIETSLGGL